MDIETLEINTVMVFQDGILQDICHPETPEKAVKRFEYECRVRGDFYEYLIDEGYATYPCGAMVVLSLEKHIEL